MEICFVLPRTESKAIGGYKIVFEYANRFANKGHKVSLLFLNTNYLKRYHLPRGLKKAYFDFLNSKEPSWFKIDERVEKISDYNSKRLNELYEESDVVVATAVKTANYVAKSFKTKNKIYLIQGRETWSLSDEEVDRTYKLGMKNVVISKWLKEIVDQKSGKESYLIPNPIDIEKYMVKNSIEHRRPFSIGCLYNPNPCKGFDNAYKVMAFLKAKYPEMEATVFGSYDRPAYFPKWISYVKNASQRETIDIYNSVSVFLCSSIDEGYGLTGIESMACGCALASTDFHAVHEYAVDGDNCLLSPVGDIDAQVKNVSLLFDNTELRLRIARKARESVDRFSWDIAIDRLIQIIGA